MDKSKIKAPAIPRWKGLWKKRTNVDIVEANKKASKASDDSVSLKDSSGSSGVTVAQTKEKSIETNKDSDPSVDDKSTTMAESTDQSDATTKKEEQAKDQIKSIPDEGKMTKAKGVKAVGAWFKKAFKKKDGNHVFKKNDGGRGAAAAYVDSQDDSDADSVFEEPQTESDVEEEAPRRSFEDFQVQQFIGEGAFGKVMRVKEKTTGTMFAMKCIPKAEVKMYQALAIREEVYFLKEVKGCHQILQLECAFQDSSRFFLVTEMCSMDLMKYILKFKTFIDDDFSFVVNELFDAVGYLHGRKILHGDIKPENALVNINSKNRIVAVKLGDLGLCEKGISFEGMRGTYSYMAPEMLEFEKVSFASDFYSLGCLLYVCVNRKLPYRNNIGPSQLLQEIKQKGPYEMQTNVTESTKNLISDLMVEDPRHRLGYNQTVRSIKMTHPFFLECGNVKKDVTEKPVYKESILKFKARVLKPAKSVCMQWLQHVEGFDYDCKVEDVAKTTNRKDKLNNFVTKTDCKKEEKVSGFMDEQAAERNENENTPEKMRERILKNIEHRKATDVKKKVVHNTKKGLPKLDDAAEKTLEIANTIESVAENIVSNIMDDQCWEGFFVNATWNESPLLPLTSYGIMESFGFDDENWKMDNEIADDVEDWNAYFVDIVWNDFNPPPFSTSYIVWNDFNPPPFLY